VSSQIYDHLCVWKFPLNSKLLGDKVCLHWIWPVKKKWLLFLLPFHSCAPCIFHILLLLMPVSGSVLLLYPGAHKISLKYLFPEKMFIEICCQKCQKCNTICDNLFLIKYIHQNLRYYETIEQIHCMVVKK
jgi:hypothetical protein